MSDTPKFQTLVEGYFLKWLITGRGVSQNTVEAYRDTFVLLLRWFKDDKHITAQSITMDDITMATIESFLIYLGQTRGNTAKTVNCRLAAIRSFCRYVSYKDPSRLDQMSKILSIPQRAQTRPELAYLEPKEIGWIIEACDTDTATGRETRLLVQLLYNSGARISEVLAIKTSDVTFDSGGSCRVTVTGKGRKQRTLPLWPETATAIRSHIDHTRIVDNGFLFPGRNVDHLTRSGARTRIDVAVTRASDKHPALATKRVTPHTFRHSTAMSMLACGIDISTIAIWLGHEGIQTTHHYMVADMGMKEAAISKIHHTWDTPHTTRYQATPKTLAFLMSL